MTTGRARRSIAELKVTVAVLTYRRPDDLRALLPLLADQAAGCPAQVTVLVVDNDPDGQARRTCAELESEPLTYVHEPAPGIAAARSRALAEAACGDVIVFIDDDERPQPGWLDRHLTTFVSHDCAGVVGPVVSSFAVPPEPWIVEGGFFVRPRRPTGTHVSVAATNNLLLDMHVVRRVGLDFDDRFGLSGGSDSLFTRQLTASGATLVWCDEAVVTDVVPASRCTREWVLRRRFRMGNSLSRTELLVAGSPVRRLLRRGGLLAAGAVRVAGGLTRFVLGAAVASRSHRANGLRTFARGAGIVAGAVGMTYFEYARKPVGDPRPRS